MALKTQRNNSLLKLRDQYPKFLELSKMAGVSDLELMMVVLGYKPAMADAVDYVPDLKNDMVKIKKLAGHFNLFFSVSKYKYIVNSPLGIFEEIPVNDRRSAKIIVSFAGTADKSLKGADYYHEKLSDSKAAYRFGVLMGYPKCCLDFGEYLNNKIGDKNNLGYRNPAIESLKKSKQCAWQLNVFASNHLSHYPCSLTCKSSLVYADKLLSSLKFLDPKRYQHLKMILTESVSLYWGIADKIRLFGQFKSDKLGFGDIKYYKIESLINSEICYQKVGKNQIADCLRIGKLLELGNRLVATEKFVGVYNGSEIIAKIPKKNKYIPVLVKSSPY